MSQLELLKKCNYAVKCSSNVHRGAEFDIFSEKPLNNSQYSFERRHRLRGEISMKLKSLVKK
ncbi:hypothetical protein LFREDSHE_22480 [Shewanella baltica]